MSASEARSRAGIAALVLGLTAILGACVAAALASYLVREGDGAWVDATPAELVGTRGIEAGDVVWLRGMRDREHPITLPGGRVLYPTRDEPSVMVDCGDTGCEGILRGRIEDAVVGAPVARRVRIVRVGEVSAAARAKASAATAVALALLALGMLALAVGVYRLRR